MLDTQDLKEFHRRFVTGVTIVTTRDRDAAPRGLIVNAFSSLSLQPPLVMVCIARTATASPALYQATHFGVNILGASHKTLVKLFSTPNTDRFQTEQWVDAPNRSPILTDAVASLEARVEERLLGESHTVFIGTVTSVTLGTNTPLIYAYSQLHDTPLNQPVA